MSRLLLTLLGLVCVSAAWAEFPKPDVYPRSWQLDFEHGTPQRIVVSVPGQPTPQAHWYMTYTVTNHSGVERTYVPQFELLASDGRLLPSDRNIPLAVFEAIKNREKNRFLEQTTQIGGRILLGEDQSRQGVAIWPEPMAEMGRFSIFVGGLSGETATVKGPENKDVILRKSLQLNYLIRGDEVYAGEDEINENPQAWVMR